ncbi:hypothetical protein SLA2020_368670 [Shorea laevis]
MIAKDLIDNANCEFHSLGTLISKCRTLLGQVPELQFNHIFREANAVADYLAKIGAKSGYPFVGHYQCPTELSILYSKCLRIFLKALNKLAMCL